MKFGWIALGFVFLTRCHVVVTTYCSKQQEEVLLSRAGESHICSHPHWLTHHCVLQAGLSARFLKPWHKEDGCRSTCVCAGGCSSCKPHFSTDCTKLFSLKRSEFVGPGWAACPWQHCRHSCVADILPTARAKRAGVYPMSKPLWLLWSCWLSLLQVQEYFTAITRAAFAGPTMQRAGPCPTHRKTSSVVGKTMSLT